ncbi:MAG TPA: substrate-binding domain-containing protein [Candidatus Ozemobacteraceae bacterium]|nr:substrate-binding domain-containing protein [Candidatus Ozemobacteraceae bacterium]
MRRVAAVFTALLALVCSLQNLPCRAEERLLFMAGAAAAPVVGELARAFEKATGIGVDVNTGGSGMLLSQIKLSKQGDIYFPGSIDFIDQALKDGIIDASTITPIVYLVPAINVQRGNPLGIKSLKDLCRPGVKVIIANPESVCLGVFATELVEKLFTPAEKKAFRNNIINYAESCEKTANSIALKSADAVLGWSVFEHWNPELIETVKLPPAEIIRISYLAVAATTYAQNPALAKRFIAFMKSPEGLDFFKKYRYFATADEALEYVGQPKPVGGDPFPVPADWMNPTSR